MYRIRRFAVIRTATVVALMYAIGIGVILIPILIFAVLFAGTSSDVGLIAAGVMVGGLLALVLYTLLGWVAVAVFCLLYNAAAKIMGGIELEVDRLAPRWQSSDAPGPWGPPPGWASPPPPPAGPPRDWGAP